jgi:hypothetical protein
LNRIAVRSAAPTHHRAMMDKRRDGGWRRLWAPVAALLCAVTLGQGASAATTVELLDTDPPSRTVTLGSGQTFYMRIAYSTDTPVRIWARPYFNGREVNAGTNPSQVHANEGEALAWFFFLGEAGQQVDEIRLSAGDGSTTDTREIARLPVSIAAGTGPAPATPEPAWLVRLKSEEERLRRADYERRMSEPSSAGDQAFFAGFMLAALALGIGGVVLPILAIRRWRGGWRLAAAVPAAWVGFVVLRIAAGTALDPTSHNLWPFEILYASVVSLALLAAMAVGRRLFSSQAVERQRPRRR